MIKSILVSKVIYSLLSGINARLYPLIAENGATYPFIIYERSNVSAKTSKDGVYEDSVRVTVRCVASTYEQSIDLAQSVRGVLQFTSYQASEMSIYNSHLVSITESYQDDAYVQTLIFDMTINN